MYKLPIVNGVKKYLEEKNISFCMPGHKHGRGFKDTKEGRELLSQFINNDITEVDGVDNLHNAQGIIKDAQRLLKEAYGSYKAYFLVNGSTSGNLAMMFATLEEGDKVIVERNCHRSIYNGIILRKLKPIYATGDLDKYNSLLYVDENNFISLMRQNKDAKAVILTYPNYYGICMDLKRILDEAKLLGMLVLVDSAHGAHFGFHEDLPRSAVELGADIVVMSAHKTLPSLTQTAYLHLNNEVYEPQLDFYVSAFLSTSPSYMLLQSMDYARFYLQEYGNEAYDRLIKTCEKFKAMINSVEGFEIIDIHSINNTQFNRSIDKTRFVIKLKEGFSGYKLSEYLRKNKIQVEMSDHKSVVLIFSPFNDENELQLLYNKLESCNMDELTSDNIEVSQAYLPKMKLLPHEVLMMRKKKINIDNSLGNICGEAVVPYPPGIPLVMPGEIIDRSVLQILNICMDNHIDVLGIEDNKICVVD